MPTQINPLTPTFSSVIAASVVADQTVGSVNTLDLSKKDGATILVRIGRRVTTALTRAAYVAIRNSDNQTITFPNQQYDSVQSSATTAAIASTLNGAVSANATSIVVNNATGFAVGDAICISQSGGTAISFNRIARISGTTFFLEQPLERVHNNADDVVTLAHVQRISLPGGDVYRIFHVNNSSQAVVVAVDAIVLNGVEVVTT